MDSPGPRGNVCHCHFLMDLHGHLVEDFQVFLCCLQNLSLLRREVAQQADVDCPLLGALADRLRPQISRKRLPILLVLGQPVAWLRLCQWYGEGAQPSLHFRIGPLFGLRCSAVGDAEERQTAEESGAWQNHGWQNHKRTSYFSVFHFSVIPCLFRPRPKSTPPQSCESPGGHGLV